MHSQVFGYRINLIYVAIAVAFYDLLHILYEFKERFVRFQNYENNDIGCLSDLTQFHCVAVYTELGIYTLDFVFTGLLIYGASSVS
jgi:hypothetical protein